VQFSVLVALSAFIPLIITVAEPGDQGDTVTGTHGTGVSTPLAAEVAAATAGLLGVLHIPKGGMFVMGTKCMIVAAIIPAAWTGIPMGIVMSVAGATPNEQAIIAPFTTSGLPMLSSHHR
jgi:hypothetical protein